MEDFNTKKQSMNKMDGKHFDNFHPYQDIIHLPHHVSKTRPHMPLQDRAAQFAPFSALTGHDAAIAETARLTDCRMELDEEQKQQINSVLSDLSLHFKEKPAIALVYFQPDRKKEGGAYLNRSGTVKKFDLDHRKLHMDDGTCIPIDDIISISLAESL